MNFLRTVEQRPMHASNVVLELRSYKGCFADVLPYSSLSTRRFVEIYQVVNRAYRYKGVGDQGDP